MEWFRIAKKNKKKIECVGIGKKKHEKDGVGRNYKNKKKME